MGSVHPFEAAQIRMVVAAIIISLFIIHLSCVGALSGAAVALAGSGDLLLASIPVKSMRGQPTTLYLLPSRSAGLNLRLK
jgi:hypothetical protein